MSSEKTEAPTPRKIARAREQGDVAVSAPFSQAVAFVVALLMARGALAALAEQTTLAWRRACSTDGAHAALVSAGAIGGELAAAVLAIAVPVLLATAATSAVATFVQTGAMFAPARVLPDLSRLDLIGGIRGLFRGQRLWSVGHACISAVLLGWFAFRALEIHAAPLAHSVGRIGESITVAGRAAEYLGRWATAIGLALGLGDLLVSRGAWRSRLKMSKVEVKREARESEGDPQIKAARHRAHQEMLTSSMLNAVRDASVVIVNPEHLATALQYRQDEDDAPRVVASGQGDLAQRIQEAARAYGVPVVRDVPVARALRELEVGDQIPEALYEAVAEILREIWEAEPEGSPTPP
jgi:flagellar biosynthetic protein FlhB